MEPAHPVPEIRRVSPRLPEGCPRELGGLLVGPHRIRRRVAELGREITAFQGGRELMVIGLLNGSVLFLADLVRRLDLPVRLGFLGASSYRDGTVPGRLEFSGDLPTDLAGRDVLVVDDILDSGATLAAVRSRVLERGPARVRTCVLLDKPSRRRVPIEADHVGFRVPDLFVVGYGLDHAERYRNLPYVGVLHPGGGKGAV